MFRFLFLGIVLFSFGLVAQPTTTTLKDPAQVREFLEVTEKIRCICLPSLPIQSCSYNMCAVSSYLKTFLENRIKEGMKTEEIVSKMQTGFGESILNDPVVISFQESGNQSMVDSLRYGFGEKILAKPSSLPINLTLGVFGLLGLLGIYLYTKKQFRSLPNQESQNKQEGQTTSQIEEEIQRWEKKL